MAYVTCLLDRLLDNCPTSRNDEYRKNIIFEHFNVELPPVNAVKLVEPLKSGAYLKMGDNSSIYSNRLQGCVINLQRFLTKAAHCYMEHSGRKKLHSE